MDIIIAINIVRTEGPSLHVTYKESIDDFAHTVLVEMPK